MQCGQPDGVRLDLNLTGSSFSVEVTDPKGRPVPGLVPLVSSAAPDTATVVFYPSQPGRYEIAASLKADGKVLVNQAAEVRVQGAAWQQQGVKVLRRGAV